MPAKKPYPTPEIGAVTHFEHVNFSVPDQGPAMLFFCEGLGFTRDPMRMVGTRNMWINAGRQQFHMPRGEAIPFPGEVGVSVKDIKRVHRNMKRIARELKGTEFSIKEVGKTLTCTSPWGHVLRVHQAGELSGRMPLAYPQLMQLITDLLVFFTPFALLRSTRTRIGCVLGSALVTLFHSSILNLGKMFLDPFNNEEYGGK